MRRERSKWRVIRVLIPIVFVLGAANQRASAQGPPPDQARPECPQNGEWTTWFNDESQRKSPVAISHKGPLALAGLTTDVPEFHDCQSFISENGASRKYLGLTAIFARENLADATAQFDSIPSPKNARGATGGSKDVRSREVGSREVSSGDISSKEVSSRRVSSNQLGGLGRAVVVGEIMSLAPDGYPQLFIRAGFNCLYLYPAATASGFEARIVPVGHDDTRCLNELDASSDVGYRLAVARNVYPPGTVPPVARWDWDKARHQELIGIACGSAWCTIAKPGFVPNAAYSTTAATPSAAVLAVKGWYDEQRLAHPKRGSPAPDVGSVIGTIVPEPDLGKHQGTPDHSDFTGRWVLVAKASLNDPSAVYRKKLNLDKSAPGSDQSNRVSLCFGTLESCPGVTLAVAKSCKGEDYTSTPGGVMPSVKPQSKDPTAGRWWSRVESAQGFDTQYYCVVRRGHENVPNLHIPGIVRWRWAIDDETMWIRCLEGCCEVEAGKT